MIKKSMIILGMGNKYFGDDGIGLIISDKLNKIFGSRDFINVESTNWGGFRIIDLLANYDEAIIIDSINTGLFPIGHIHKYNYTDLVNSVRMISFHDINIATAVELARKLKIKMPDKITVYAIEIKNAETMTEEINPALHASIGSCIDMIINATEEVFELSKETLIEL